MDDFGTKIKELRKERKITQRDLADKVGVDFTYISKIENGKLENFPSLETISKIAKELGANSDDLILLARKVPDSLRETIMDDELAAEFLRKVPKMNDDLRKQIQDIINKA